MKTIYWDSMINYYTRQLGLAHPDKLNKKIAIIGAGSTGSWTALALLKMGCSDVTVYDFDIVEEGNVGSQLYTSRDIGKTKLESLKEKLGFLTEIDLKTEQVTISLESVPVSLQEKEIIILALDNIETRKIIFDSLSTWNGILIDARMAGNALEIYTVNKERFEDYKKTLFVPEKAEPVECSMRSVVYNVFIIAGLITDIVAKISNNKSVPFSIDMDLENFTLYV